MMACITVALPTWWLEKWQLGSDLLQQLSWHDARLNMLYVTAGKACAVAKPMPGRLRQATMMQAWQAACRQAKYAHQLTQQPKRKLSTIWQDFVRHTFKPVASGNLPMRMLSCTLKPSKLLLPCSFSKLVKHKLGCKFACVLYVRVSLLKHIIACHVKDFVAAVMISSL